MRWKYAATRLLLCSNLEASLAFSYGSWVGWGLRLLPAQVKRALRWNKGAMVVNGTQDFSVSACELAGQDNALGVCVHVCTHVHWDSPCFVECWEQPVLLSLSAVIFFPNLWQSKELPCIAPECTWVPGCELLLSTRPDGAAIHQRSKIELVKWEQLKLHDIQCVLFF